MSNASKVINCRYGPVPLNSSLKTLGLSDIGRFRRWNLGSNKLLETKAAQDLLFAEPFHKLRESWMAYREKSCEGVVEPFAKIVGLRKILEHALLTIPSFNGV